MTAQSRGMAKLWLLECTSEHIEGELDESIHIRAQSADDAVDFWRAHLGFTDMVKSPFRGRIIPDLDALHPEYTEALRVWCIHVGHEDGVLGVANGRPGGWIELMGYVLPNP